MNEPEPDIEDSDHQSHGLKASLEQYYFQVYLQSKGLTVENLKNLPENEARKIRRDAFLYASTKLAEEETRARFVQDLHGNKPGL
jgi:hypothetical protein